MKLNEHMLEITGRPDEYGEWLYWVSIMGAPSATEPWGWQIDGHHLIVNCFVLGDQMVLTPNFMGSEPVSRAKRQICRHPRLRGGGAQGLRAHERAFARAARPGDDRHGAALRRDHRPPSTTTTLMPYQGMRFGDLSSEQRELLERLIGLYIGRIRPGHAEIRYDEVKRHLDDT